MAKAEASVKELVDMVERGELRLPEMQRRYVWRATRVRDLLDSLYRGYPSGAILIWETDEDVPTRDFAIQQSESPYRNTKLLLDGQQRLTSLSAILRNEPLSVKGRKKPIEILFNLEHPEEHTFLNEVSEDSDQENAELEDASEDELLNRFNQLTFVVATKKLAGKENWVSVGEVLNESSDAPFLTQAGIKALDDPRYDKYSGRLKRLRAIKDYIYRMDVLERKLSYEEVTEIFVRVNSLGAKLRSSDLALAQITAKWRDSLKIFQEFQTECADRGFDLDIGIHIKNMVAFITGQSRFKSVGSMTVDQLQDGWIDCKEGMRFAINFLQSNVQIESPVLLSSPFILITVAYFGHQKHYKISPKEEANLKFWILIASGKGRYSRGSTESYLDQDLNRVRMDDLDALIELLDVQFGGLNISAAELEGRNARSAYFKTMFLAFQEAGAKDWNSNLAISISHKGAQHKLQFHHIFPRAVLKGKYSTSLINDIANFAFIGGKTNRRISAKEPKVYFKDLLSTEMGSALDSQCIPYDDALLEVDSYEAFLDKRRELIVTRLNEYLYETRKVSS